MADEDFTPRPSYTQPTYTQMMMGQGGWEEGGNSISDDPQLRAALEMQAQYERSMGALFRSYSRSELERAGFSLNSPPMSSPILSSVPPSAPATTQPTPIPTAPNTRQVSPDNTPSHTHTTSRSRGFTEVSSPPPSNRSRHSFDFSGGSGQRRSLTGSGSRALGKSGGSSGQRRSSTGSGSRASGEGGGCFGACFGSACIPDDEEDEPDEQGLFYVLSDETGGPYLDERGTNVVNQMRELTSTTYKNSFIKWEDQKPRLFNYVIGVLHQRFPNPEAYRFSDDWAKKSIRTFLNNKRSRIRRLANKAVEDGNEDRLLPTRVHRDEWKYAMREIKEGVHFPQQAVAHASQLARYGATHWGRGGKEAWKVRFVSVLFLL